MASRSTIYPFLHFGSSVDWKDVDKDLLSRLNRLGMQQKTVITVTSGYRSVAQQQYLWDHAKQLGLVRGVTVAAPGTSDHNFGRAVDATVNGKPIGKAFPRSAFANVGLKYLPRDTVHVTYLSSKEGGSTPAPQSAPQASVATDTSGSAVPSVTAPQSPAPPTALGTPGTDVEMPGSVNYTVGPRATPYGLWQQASQGDLVSPETMQMLKNAQLSGSQ